MNDLINTSQNNSTFFYRLGHCSELSVAEYFSLTGDQIGNDNSPKYNPQWLMSNTKLNVNLSGSLIFGCEVVGEAQYFEKDKLRLALATHLEFNNYKKVGLYIPIFEKGDLFSLAKKFCNRVNIIDKLPNFGFWKQTNNWIISVRFGNKIYLCKILSYSDQEFWSNLDQNLPRTDMSRGVINLKLARSMLNLTTKTNKKTTIWDNFAGQGRVLVAGMDLKNQFLATDIDATVISQLNDNLKFATSFWERTNYNKQKTENIAELTLNKPQDATKVLRNENLDNLDMSTNSLAIVTEGYLGTNFKSEPTKIQMLEVVNSINEMWINVIKANQDTKVSEIIGCVPFYPKVNFVPKYTFWNTEPSWKLVALTPENDTVLYSRENSNVGHLVFKMIKL